MSFLTPLYLLGALAVAGPIIFHLIRRSPRGEVPFSSLMFLSPTPPRLTRRSRLDDWLLFLLRVAALCLLAFAFARPFLREAMALDSGDSRATRILVLLDTSASMRRGDLWQRAVEQAENAVRDARPGDTLAIYGFDRATRPVMTFEEAGQIDSSQRSAIAVSRLNELKPTWHATVIGAALVQAVTVVEDVADTTTEATRMPRRIVLVSDLQEGSDVKALAGFEWPSDVELELKTVTAKQPNASIHRLADAATEDRESLAAMRIQVSNEAENAADRFAISWKDAQDKSVGAPIDAYVPAGESRVFQVERPVSREPLQALELTGDAFAFDNRAFIADRLKRDESVVYVGAEQADDPAGLLYYLDRVFRDSPERSVQVERVAPEDVVAIDSPQETPLVVVGTTLSQQNVEALRSYVESGGTVLAVLTTIDQAASFSKLTGLPLDTIEEADVTGDVMLGEIAYRHPLFAPLAGPQYNDFTKIRFWKYRRLNSAATGEAKVLARFENGDPAVIEAPFGKGRVIVFASGWSPGDSQFARSSKFVPLMISLLTLGSPAAIETADLRVGDRLPVASLAARIAGRSATVTLPSGTAQQLSSGAATFDETDTPGVYSVDADGEQFAFAVNLDPSESRTRPMPVETLEQLGCKLYKGTASSALSEQSRRQMLNVELESRQKLWRWVILAALTILAVETWLAGRLARPRRASEEVLAT